MSFFAARWSRCAALAAALRAFFSSGVSPLRVAQKDPCARERAKGRERGEGGYKGGAGGRKGCGERTAAWAMVDATVGRAWAGLGLGPGTHLAQP